MPKEEGLQKWTLSKFPQFMIMAFIKNIFKKKWDNIANLYLNNLARVNPANQGLLFIVLENILAKIFSY